jgi:hypothetical protein
MRRSQPDHALGNNYPNDPRGKLRLSAKTVEMSECAVECCLEYIGGFI